MIEAEYFYLLSMTNTILYSFIHHLGVHRTHGPTVQDRDTVCLKDVALTLYSSGLKLHRGISGRSVGGYFNADFWHNAPVKLLLLKFRRRDKGDS